MQITYLTMSQVMPPQILQGILYFRTENARHLLDLAYLAARRTSIKKAISRKLNQECLRLSTLNQHMMELGPVFTERILKELLLVEIISY